MKISDVISHKQSTSAATGVTIAPGDTVAALVAALSEHNVGALVVVEHDGTVAGIVSERDVVRSMATDGATVLETNVGQIMTSSVVSCTAADAVDTIAETMTQRRIRHMPVLADGQLAGIVTIGDVVAARLRTLETERCQLEEYITRG